jgi:release factor glutamine methyltransferase
MTILNFKQYSLDIPARVYLPSDDTDLMIEVLDAEIIKSNKTFDSAIELGSGNGFLSLEIYDNVKEIISTDINPIVIDYLLNVKEQYNLEKQKITYSNLFDSIDEKKKFDLIIFNPPYVPSEEILSEDDDEINGYDLAVNGGEQGREIIDEFVKQLPRHLEKGGVCYLLVSSLNSPLDIIENLKLENLSAEIIDSKKLFFEELFVLKIIWK